MTTPPALIFADQRRKDDDHIGLLSVFHFVVGGMALLGIGFLVMHYWMMNQMFSNPAMWNSAKGNSAPPKEFFEIFVWFYLFMGAALAIACVLNVLSGMFLRQRKHRTFSLVVAGLDCMQIPLGTVLGIFTIMVLMRDSVREAYATDFALEDK